MLRQPVLAGFEDLFEPGPAALRPDLWDFPNVSTEALHANAKWIGLAGESLVDSTLLRFGIYTTPLPETLPADRLLHYRPDLPLRLQIKTASQPRACGYCFNVMHGYHRTRSGVRPYEAEDFDLVALVLLPENVVKFSSEKRPSQVVSFREIDQLRRYPRRSLDRALDELGLTAQAESSPAPLMPERKLA